MSFDVHDRPTFVEETEREISPPLLERIFNQLSPKGQKVVRIAIFSVAWVLALTPVYMIATRPTQEDILKGKLTQPLASLTSQDWSTLLGEYASGVTSSEVLRAFRVNNEEALVEVLRKEGVTDFWSLLKHPDISFLFTMLRKPKAIPVDERVINGEKRFFLPNGTELFLDN